MHLMSMSASRTHLCSSQDALCTPIEEICQSRIKSTCTSVSYVYAKAAQAPIHANPGLVPSSMLACGSVPLEDDGLRLVAQKLSTTCLHCPHVITQTKPHKRLAICRVVLHFVTLIFFHQPWRVLAGCRPHRSAHIVCQVHSGGGLLSTFLFLLSDVTLGLARRILQKLLHSFHHQS